MSWKFGSPLVLVAQQPRQHVVGDLLAGLQPRFALVDQRVEVRAPPRRVGERTLAHALHVADVEEHLPEDAARPAQLGRRVGPRCPEVVRDDAIQRGVGELCDHVDGALVVALRDKLARCRVHGARQLRQVLARHRAVQRRMIVAIERRVVVEGHEERARHGFQLWGIGVRGEARRVAEHLPHVLVERDDRRRAGPDDRVQPPHDREGLVGLGLGELPDEVGHPLGQAVLRVAQPSPDLLDLVDDAHVAPSSARPRSSASVPRGEAQRFSSSA